VRSARIGLAKTCSVERCRFIAVEAPANLRDWVQYGDGGEGYSTYVLNQAASTPASPNDPIGRLARAPGRR
jgi:hypothetical protein